MKLSVWMPLLFGVLCGANGLRPSFAAEKPTGGLKQAEMPLAFMPINDQETAFHVWTPSAVVTFDRNGLRWRAADGKEVSQVFVNGNRKSSPEGLDAMKGQVHIYRGKDPRGWRRSMPMYGRLVYRNVYPGIDVVYKGFRGKLKRDILVAPGVDPSQIRMAFEGVSGLSLNAKGMLVMEMGTGSLEASKPFLYQDKDNARHVVAGQYLLHGDDQVGFLIGKYDPNLPLVIDPVISSGTYGGSGGDAILAGYATDTAYYFTGQTTSTDLPTMNPAQATNAGDPDGIGDAFLACFDKATMTLNYATYYGGSGSDQANGIYVDNAGNVTIAGWTDSPDLAVPNASQGMLGGLTDGFLARFDANGALVWATYHGGSGDDQFADLDGNDFFQQLTVVGFTNSSNYPLANASDSTCGCSNGAADAVYTRFNFDGSLDTSTYLGGHAGTSTASGTAPANDVALDVFVLGETAYVTGWTQSIDFPKQPFSGDHAGGRDAFYVLFGFDGRRDYSILLGGSGDDVGDGIAAFNQSQVILTGSTTSDVDFPVTANAQQPTYGGGSSDAFIARINGSNSPIRRSVSYWGGSGADAGREVHFSRDNGLFLNRYTLAGVTDSSDFPLDASATTATANGLDSFLITGETQGNNNFNVFTGALFGGPGSDGVFSLSTDTASGPFSVLAVGATDDANGLPKRSGLLRDARGFGENSASRIGNADEGFFNIYCPEACVAAMAPDLKVTMILESTAGTPVTFVETGMQYRYRIVVENIGLGNAPANASVFVTIPNAQIVIAIGLPEVCSEIQIGDEGIVDCVLDSTNPIAPGDSRTLFVAFTALTPDQAVIDGVIRASALALPQAGDLDPLDNVVFADRFIKAEILGGAGGNITGGNSEDEGDPISTSNGAFHFEIPLLDLGGPMPLVASLSYRSDLPALVNNINPKRFWFRPFAMLLPEVVLNGQTYTSAQLVNGDIISFVQNGAGWDLVQGDVDLGFGMATGNTVTTPYELVQDGVWFYIADPRLGKVYLFENVGGIGLIRAVMDRSGNTHRYLYAMGDGNPPTRVEDGLGRYFDFEHISVGGSLNVYLSKITDQGGRQIQAQYDIGADNAGLITLRSITDAMSQTTVFEYAGPDLPGHRITKQIRPNGQANLEQRYDFQALDGFHEQRITTQTHVVAPKAGGPLPAGSFSYDASMNRVTYTNELGKAWEYQSTDHHGQNSAIIDPELNQIQFAFDGDGFLEQVTDRDHRVTGVKFHKDSGLPVMLINPDGGVYKTSLTEQVQNFTNPVSAGNFSFSFYDVTRVDLPDGTFATFQVDGQGNPTQFTLPSGAAYLFTFNGSGQIETVENPLGGVTTQTYDSHGNLIATTDSQAGLTQISYDSLFRNTMVTMPDGSTLLYAWNNNDRLIQFTDQRGNRTDFAYDALGNLNAISGPDNDMTTLTHNRFDQLLTITDALNRTQRFEVNAGHQITAFDDGSGDLSEYTYNGAGFRDSVRRGGFGFDEVRNGEGDLIGIVSADGLNTTQFMRETRGLVDRIITPQNRNFSFAYDAVDRITSRTRPSGRTTRMVYDANGNLAHIDYPGGIDFNITRNGLGLATRYRDGAGRNWDFSYSVMGKEASRTDPLGRTTTLTYDANRQVARRNNPDTIIDVTYDGLLVTNLDYQSNVPGNTQAPFSMNFSYDHRGNLTSADGITLTYDLANQLTSWTRGSSTFNQVYDAAGRLETIAYPNSAMVVTYTYDARGNLASVSDDLTNTLVEFTYDALGRQIGIARSNNVDTTLNYSADGFLVRLQEAATGANPFIDLQYVFDGDGNLIEASQVAPLLPEANIGLTDTVMTYDAASQLTNSGFVYDGEGRLTQDPVRGVLTWDLASRLVGIGGVTLTYDGLGHITGKDDGQVINYHTHPNLGGSHVLMAHTQGASGPGSQSQFYVFTPAGRLLYGVDQQAGDAPFFYHFDRRGSTLAVTDGMGQVTEAFAYGPFGELVGSLQLKRGLNQNQLYKHAGRDGVLGLPGDLDLMDDRVYFPDQGRFGSPMIDFNMVDRGTADPSEMSPYGFGWNRPLDVNQSNGSNWTNADPGVTESQVLDTFGELRIRAEMVGNFSPTNQITNPLDEGRDPNRAFDPGQGNPENGFSIYLLVSNELVPIPVSEKDFNAIQKNPLLNAFSDKLALGRNPMDFSILDSTGQAQSPKSAPKKAKHILDQKMYGPQAMPFQQTLDLSPDGSTTPPNIFSDRLRVNGDRFDHITKIK